MEEAEEKIEFENTNNIIRISPLEAEFLVEIQLSVEDWKLIRDHLSLLYKNPLTYYTLTMESLKCERRHEALHKQVLECIRQGKDYSEIRHQIRLNDLLENFINCEQIRELAEQRGNLQVLETFDDVMFYRVLEEIRTNALKELAA